MNSTTNTPGALGRNAASVREAVAGEVRAALARDGRGAPALAAQIGISRNALNRKLRGLAPFHTEELLAISDALGVDPGQFVSVRVDGQPAA